MTWRRCDFEPLGVIAAGEARSLEDGGQASLGDLWPAAFAGVIRTLALRHTVGTGDYAGARLAVGADGGASFPFRFVGPFLRFGEALLVPSPRHLVVTEHSSGALLDRGVLGVSSPEVLSDVDTEVALLTGPEDTSPDPRWITFRHLCAILAGPYAASSGLELENSVAASDLRLPERRQGHRRAASGVPEDGALWGRSTWRFQSGTSPADARGFTGFAAGLEANLLPGDALSRLGGDGHLASIQVRDVESAWQPFEVLGNVLEARLAHSRRFLLYLATPAVFDRGWRPQLTDRGWRPQLTDAQGLLPISLCAAAVGRPVVIAGWDLRKGEPKPVRRGVPAGSIYFFEFAKDCDAPEVARRVIQRCHFPNSVSDLDPSLGLGISVVGLWPEGEASTLEGKY